MKLLVVESNTKAKTLGRILGKDYQILASVGHIYELAQKNNGVDIKNNFAIKYELMSRSRQYVKTIISSAKSAETVFLATDPDREGEIIAWHLEQEIVRNGIDKKNIRRVTFSEITGTAVCNSLSHSRDIDINLVQAQQSRAILDYLIGFNLSPVLWRKLPGARSAGRVQSAVLRLICEREIERNKFTVQEYWTIDCLLQGKNLDHKIMTSLVAIDGNKLEKFDLNTQKQVQDISKRIQQNDFICTEIKNTNKNINPKPPLITSTLQQTSFNRYGIGASKVMRIAQELYEGVSINGKFTGLITYMRTDSVYMSQEFIKTLRKYISQKFSADYVPSQPLKHKQINKRSQEAHECIRPTNIDMHPDQIKSYLTADQYKLYSLIWHYSIASQMSSALVKTRHLIFKDSSQDITCRSHIQKLHFDGFMKLMTYDRDAYSYASWIEKMQVGDSFVCTEIKPIQHFTEPPAHYTEGSLIKTMEKYGIGRPSTYANIIDVIKRRNYINVEKNTLVPSQLGFAVTIFLCSLFRNYTDRNFTASMENNLDQIAVGELDRNDFLAEFWKFFSPQIESVMNKDYQKISDIMSTYLTDNELWDRKKICNKCGHNMIFCIIRGNLLYSCSQYPDCKHFVQIFGSGKDHNQLSDKPLWQENESSVYLRLGLYGFYLSLESTKDTKTTKIKTVSIPNSFQHLSIDLLRIIMRCPWTLGQDQDGQEVKLCCGKYGVYLQYNGQNIPVRKVEDLQTLDLAKAWQIIDQSKAKRRKSRTTKG